jgi:hypothetical protein
VLIEASHELSNGRPALEAGLLGGADERFALRDRQHRQCPPHPIQALTAGLGDALQGRPLLSRHRPEHGLL